MRILALESSQHFKGRWHGRAKAIIPCDFPGIHSSDLRSFAFRNLDMRYFPFENPRR